MCCRRAASLLLPLLLLAGALQSGCAPARCTSVAAFGNLGADVNSPFDDYAPALSDTATLVFSSSRVEPGRGGLQEQYRDVRPAHLYFSMRIATSWDRAQSYELIFGREEIEAATITFAPSGSAFNTVAYIGACSGENTIGGCDLYAVTEGTTAALVNLGPELNSSSWDGQPFVTRDGTRLYFASDRSGGAGGSDIWIADRLPSGSWGTPYNAGPAINSSDDELSPFVDSDGSILFAAQTESAGLDIFRVPPSARVRVALPAPYNSPDDDLTPYRIDNTLYLASRRPGGCGGYDLYGFPYSGR